MDNFEFCSQIGIIFLVKYLLGRSVFVFDVIIMGMCESREIFSTLSERAYHLYSLIVNLDIFR